ncbi:uncharacterized protein LOC115265156 [Aedes albopictus]|uniref:Peptidase aspartic putative domain-containing protein n=1 Tax=Aedes albopictus TaxID=7160 RepID=A0ABM2A5A4_AEDAL
MTLEEANHSANDKRPAVSIIDLPPSSSTPQQQTDVQLEEAATSQLPSVSQSSQEPVIQQQAIVQPTPTTQASVNPLLPQQLHTQQQQSRSAASVRFGEWSLPPSALRAPLSYTPPRPPPVDFDAMSEDSSVHQTRSSHRSPQQPAQSHVTQQHQMQDQQAMWGHFQQQLSARQVVPKELPTFTGNPEEWPLFISSYRNSTAMCGYSQAENLMRLQKCLRGKALEAVRSNLLLPSSVPKIMQTLETLFGSPERLVQSLLIKVRNVPTPKAERLETLVNFGLVVQNLVGHLRAANQHAHLNNPTLLQELVDKLPPHLRLDWALYKRNAGQVDLGSFCDYMNAITSAASDVAHFTDFDGVRPCGHDKQKKDKAFVNAHVSEPRKLEQQRKKVDTQDRPCYVCQSISHRIKDCSKFKSLSLGERLKTVETHQLCAGCLVPHGRWACRSSRTCGIGDCTKQHHPSLHPNQPAATKTTGPESSGARAKSDATINVHRGIQSATIFRVIPVVLYGNEAKLSTFAFLDEGKVARHEKDSRLVSLKISGEDSSRSFPLSGVSTVKQLDIPVQTMQYEELASQYPYLSGLPVKSYEEAVPRILIGLDNIKLSLPLKTRGRQINVPVAAKTRLGWTIFGSIDNAKVDSLSPVFHICKSAEESSLHDLVKGYFATENLGVSVTCAPEADEDRRAKDILQRTTVKRADGHYETGLLWRYDIMELPPSYGMAERRLICLEKKLRKYPELQASLDKQIAEYQYKGYAHKATAEELEENDPLRTWYLPLGVVTNPRKPGKVRIIWDAAAKAHGVSLNDMLLKGPDLLTSLPAVLCRFRQRKIAIAGDIREMYHQLKIRREDRQVQRFLYRSGTTKKPDVFVMDVATFGSTCSPCSANFVKNKNAMEWKDDYPEAATAVVENHYVDDYLDSRDSEDDMVKLATDVRMIQESAGFELRNWRSNSKKVLHLMGEEATDCRKDFSVDKESQMERVLGMAWLPDEDVFVYSVKLPNDFDCSESTNTITKRSVLRFVMSVFDPLGLISNLLIHGKMLIQDLWRAKVGWDEAIPAEISKQWERWIAQLPKLDQIRIPRCYFPGYDPDSFQTMQLHVFVDASESAFACVAYFRIVDRGQPRCTLVASKAKVAPLISMSVPRLELQAAVIGSRLAKSIAEYHTIPVRRRFFWSDSTTVLAWINSDTRSQQNNIWLHNNTDCSSQQQQQQQQEQLLGVGLSNTDGATWSLALHLYQHRDWRVSSSASASNVSPSTNAGLSMTASVELFTVSWTGTACGLRTLRMGTNNDDQLYYD